MTCGHPRKTGIYKNKETVETSKPDIICANETWLSTDTSTSEFILDYDVYRKDISYGYGEVLIVIKRDIISHTYSLNSQCEIVCTKIELFKANPLIVCSVYRPTNSVPDYNESLCESFNEIARAKPKSTLWITGDTNLPDIDLETNYVKSHQYQLKINEDFLTTINCSGLDQIVDIPTRGDNILDIFLTNRPTLVNKCEVVPGISDHDMVLVDSNVIVTRNKPVKREVRLLKKLMLKVSPKTSTVSAQIS